MPRTTFCGMDRKNKIKDLPKHIKGKLFEKEMHDKDLADSLGITKQGFSYKMQQGKKGADTFTYGDLLTIIKATNMTDSEILEIMRI